MNTFLKKYSKKNEIPVKELEILYQEQKTICLSQNYYMRKFVTRKQQTFPLLQKSSLTLYYTSWFQNYGFTDEILCLSKENDFYLDDLNRLLKLDKEHVQLTLDNYHCIYLKDPSNSNEIIGYIFFTTSPKEVLVQFLLIHDKYRKKGLGTFLLNFVEITVYHLRSLGFVKNKNGIICSYTTNPSMGSLLEKMNYKREEHTLKRIQDHQYYRKSFR